MKNTDNIAKALYGYSIKIVRQCFCTWFIFYIVECQAVISVQKAYKTVLILSFAYFLPFFEEKYNSCAIRARFVRNLYAYKYLYIRIICT